MPPAGGGDRLEKKKMIGCSSEARATLGGTSLVEGAEVVFESLTSLLAETGVGR